MTKLFKDKSTEDQANSLALFLPEGKTFDSKAESTSTLRKFLEGLSGELKLVYDGMSDLSQDYNINECTELLTRWESAVGIPDECFKGTGTVEERRTHVLLKLAKMNVQTVEDFVELAETLGFTGIEITPLQDVALPPYDVPFTPTSAPGSRYVILVNGLNVVIGVPPYDVPFTPSSQGSSLLQCVFDKVKPVNVRAVYSNSNDPITFVPSDLIDLGLWLKSDDVSTITESGGLVTDWNDKSGNNNHATASGAGRPVTNASTINGKNALAFSSNANFMTIADAITLNMDSGNGFTIFMVVDYSGYSAHGSGINCLLSKGEAAFAGSTYNLQTAADNFIDFQSGANEVAASTTDISGAAVIITATMDNSAEFAELFVNGVSVGTRAAATVNSDNALALIIGGDTTINKRGDGSYAEIIIYPRLLAASDIGLVEGYLSGEWGMAVS